MSTGGTDVKVYTVGPNYAHAEARKSPVVDGRVQRDENGKEERFPVLLTPDEKEIARRVCLAFGQMVCGFDLLRAKGRSYVCDVNGWSFVKNSTKYFDDAALCLRAMILQAVAPHHSTTQKATQEADETVDEADAAFFGTEGTTKCEKREPRVSKTKKTSSKGPEVGEELRAVLAVIRHGDRTPKQKMKMRVRNQPLLDLLARCTGDRPRKQAKLKTPQRLQELLNICRVLYSERLKDQHKYHDKAISPLAPSSAESSDTSTRLSLGSKEEWEEEVEQWKQVISILQEGGHFSGINRKAQLKPLAWEEIPPSERKEGKDGKEGKSEQVTEALLILKFGGVLTHLGKKQAEFLGRDFRMRMYPGGNYYEPGNMDGLLRLHSTYRHDLKIYSSDEGRVQITAAAFAKGLLDLETTNDQLTPILASLVNKDAKLLDFVTHEVEEDILHAKQKLYNIMTEGHVKGRGKNKEYSTSDTAVHTDIERSGPVGYDGLRRSSASNHASSSPIQISAPSSPAKDAGHGMEKRMGASYQNPASYMLMAADRARSLKAARRAVSSAAYSAISSFRNAMVAAVAGGIATEASQKNKPQDGLPPKAETTQLSSTPATAQVEAQRSASVASVNSDGSVSLAAQMVDQLDLAEPNFLNDPTFMQYRLPSSVRTSLDETQEVSLSLEPAYNPRLDELMQSPAAMSAENPRSSWNSGMAKDLMRSRMLLGLPEDPATSHRLSNATGGYVSDHAKDGNRSDPEKMGRNSKSPGTHGDEFSEDEGGDVGSGFDEFKQSVEGSISRRPPGVPPEPLKLLRLMVDLIQGLTRQLRDECFQHTNKTIVVGSPTTWVDALGALAPRGSMPKGGLAELKTASVPAGGESFLLMHARWKKLEQDIYHPRKGRFDISKVPDVYDAAKYDAIHNSHLDLDGLEELYRISKQLAEGVVPNEYGTHPHSKLRIGGTIAHSLLVKLLTDMSSTRDESFIGMPQTYLSDLEKEKQAAREARGAADSEMGAGGQLGRTGGSGDGSGSLYAEFDDDVAEAETTPVDDDDAAALKEEEEIEVSTTRLNHRYASHFGVQSPQRHVRTRLYFTSESHIHSLLNVLRYCNLEVGQQPGGTVSRRNSANLAQTLEAINEGRGTTPPSLLSHRLDTLEGVGDLDYLTHIVFRMYERFDVPPTDPKRFRIEILLSTGVGLDPFKNNVIHEIDKVSDQAFKKEKKRSAAASPKETPKAEGVAPGDGRETKVGSHLAILRQFPIQNDRAHRASPAQASPSTAAQKEKQKPDFLTLNDFESYLWKFRRKTVGRDGDSGLGNSTSSYLSATGASDWNSPKKGSPPLAAALGKAGMGGPKKSKNKKMKKKGSDSDSD